MLNPFAGAGIVLVSLAAIFLVVKFLQTSGLLTPEASRKSVHIGMGLIALTFPWIFSSPVHVWITGAIAFIGMATLRLYQKKYSRFADVLHGVNRSSYGEFHFILSICILFYLTHNEPLFYIIPILVLSLADAAAAIMGVKFGKRHYTADTGTKSIEGSIAFFVVTFIATCVPMFLWSTAGLYNILAISLSVGFIVMLLEAIALHGRDNLYLPLGTYALLKSYIFMDWTDISVRLAAGVALLIFVFLYRKRSNLDDAALIGASLVGYSAFAIGGLKWVIAPLILFLTYKRIFPIRKPEMPSGINVHSVLGVCAGGLIILLIYSSRSNSTQYYIYSFLFFIYSLLYAAQLAITGIASLSFKYPEKPVWRNITISSMLSWVLIMAPWMLINNWQFNYSIYSLPPLKSIGYFVVSIIPIIIACILFYFVQPNIREDPIDKTRWMRQAIVGIFAASLGILQILLLGD
jgi:phytol kinase